MALSDSERAIDFCCNSEFSAIVDLWPMNLKPSCRMVLLKGYGPDGFRFFTSYQSRKATDLAENPNAAMLFYWPVMNSSIRIEGPVIKLSPEIGSEYWKKRPIDSQISAAISDQSKPVPSRQYLEERCQVLKSKLEDSNELEKPDFWGGYCLNPESFEFWQGQSDRLHDRFRFRILDENENFDNDVMIKGDNNWIVERLSP